jgi:hypothetical protein
LRRWEYGLRHNSAHCAWIPELEVYRFGPSSWIPAAAVSFAALNRSRFPNI